MFVPTWDSVWASLGVKTLIGVCVCVEGVFASELEG